MAAERKEHSKLFVPTKESGKLYKIDNYILASVSGIRKDGNNSVLIGIVADANYLIDYSRVHC